MWYGQDISWEGEFISVSQMQVKIKPESEIFYYVTSNECNKWFILLDIFTIVVYTRVGNLEDIFP